MTAAVEPTAKTPPRALIRTFWKLHRAAYRLTRGRFGLSRPVSGAKFGMMRLATVGRRSGKSRMTIVGYYEDGPNLVTLAMNGWGDKEPAWWLNLQAQPDTTVRLADGPLAVRARAATDTERDRLWARFADFPGWGDDIDALAATRPTETTIVVFEPRWPRSRHPANDRSRPPRAWCQDPATSDGRGVPEDVRTTRIARTRPSHGAMSRLVQVPHLA